MLCGASRLQGALAARFLGLHDVHPLAINGTAETIDLPRGCYYKVDAADGQMLWLHTPGTMLPTVSPTGAMSPTVSPSGFQHAPPTPRAT